MCSYQSLAVTCSQTSGAGVTSLVHTPSAMAVTSRYSSRSTVRWSLASRAAASFFGPTRLSEPSSPVCPRGAGLSGMGSSSRSRSPMVRRSATVSSSSPIAAAPAGVVADCTRRFGGAEGVASSPPAGAFTLRAESDFGRAAGGFTGDVFGAAGRGFGSGFGGAGGAGSGSGASACGALSAVAAGRGASAKALRNLRWKVPRNESSVSLMGRARASLARMTSSSRNLACSRALLGARAVRLGKCSAFFSRISIRSPKTA